MDITVKEIKIELPADVLLSTSLSEKQLAREMREMLAFKYFAEGRLSSGTAAKLAGMTRVSFLLRSSEKKIEWLSYSDDELRRELV